MLSAFVRLGASAVVGVGLIVGVILVHDAFTYSERHVERVPADPLSLHPRRGGKKNLPIIEVNLDGVEDDAKKGMQEKPRLVVIGGGWGVSLLSHHSLHGVTKRGRYAYSRPSSGGKR